ncbi:MAG: DNA-directed RNA polymerase subunit RpoH/Rpb5 C-terminal domain-containing protein [Candidatus Micrarchaeota archaeon]
MVDVLAHSLVPEMKILSDAEKTKVLKKYDISEDELPRMPASDPAVLALKATAGDVIRIDRDEPTGKYQCYKLVV